MKIALFALAAAMAVLVDGASLQGGPGKFAKGEVNTGGAPTSDFKKSNIDLLEKIKAILNEITGLENIVDVPKFTELVQGKVRALFETAQVPPKLVALALDHLKQLVENFVKSANGVPTVGEVVNHLKAATDEAIEKSKNFDFAKAVKEFQDKTRKTRSAEEYEDDESDDQSASSEEVESKKGQKDKADKKDKKDKKEKKAKKDKHDKNQDQDEDEDAATKKGKKEKADKKDKKEKKVKKHGKNQPEAEDKDATNIRERRAAGGSHKHVGAGQRNNTAQDGSENKSHGHGHHGKDKNSTSTDAGAGQTRGKPDFSAIAQAFGGNKDDSTKGGKGKHSRP